MNSESRSFHFMYDQFFKMRRNKMVSMFMPIPEHRKTF